MDELTTQYQPNTNWIVDFENEEEIVEYCLIDDGDLLLARRHTLKPIGTNRLEVDEEFVFTMSHKCFAEICKRAIDTNTLK